jgi:hypothetical protein
MRPAALTVALGVLVALLSACGASAVRTPTPAPIVAPSVKPSLVTAKQGDVQIVSVAGASAGGRASVEAKAPAGSDCAIAYRTPSNSQGNAAGLEAKRAGTDGVVAWSWVIPPATWAGTGSVQVTCTPGGSASARIVIP